MKDQVLRIEYFTLMADDRPGVGAELGKQMMKENITLLGVLETPAQAGKVQIDILPEHPEAFIRMARKIGLTLSEPKLGFLLQGSDRPSAITEPLEKLASNGINVRSMIGVNAGDNRYGTILFVDPANIEKATQALGAAVVTHRV